MIQTMLTDTPMSGTVPYQLGEAGGRPVLPWEEQRELWSPIRPVQYAAERQLWDIEEEDCQCISRVNAKKAVPGV
jgi:hypothetical protein